MILLYQNRKLRLPGIQSYKLEYNIAKHLPVKMVKETNEESINIDPYSCKIIISRLEKIGPVTVTYIPKETSRCFILLAERWISNRTCR